MHHHDVLWTVKDTTLSLSPIVSVACTMSMLCGCADAAYRRCAVRCLTNGLPADYVAQARNYSATAYGYSDFDFYLDRWGHDHMPWCCSHECIP